MPKKNEGTKTIKLTLNFWTNVSEKDGIERIELPKKTCWDGGFVSAVSNNLHGIRSGIFKHFRSLEEIPEAIKDVAKRSGIKIISSKKDKDYKEALKKIKEAELI